jgi:hypothetical protein
MIRVFSHSVAGGHAENEDAFEAGPHPRDPACFLFAVADGQGGRAGGKEAARLASKTCLDTASALTPAKLSQPTTWAGIVAAADLAVAADPAAGFTTMIGCCINANWICGASNGDSAVLYLSGRTAEILTARQHKNPPVGSGAANFVPFGALLRGPWVLLAMTDGVWKYAGMDILRTIASEEQAEVVIGRVLDRVRLPRSGGLQDDFTLLVLSHD